MFRAVMERGDECFDFPNSLYDFSEVLLSRN